MSEWQPIETAPKDGTVVLLYGRHNWYADDEPHENDKISIVIGVYDCDEWTTCTDNPYQDIVFPTHWMPLPDAPRS